MNQDPKVTRVKLETNLISMDSEGIIETVSVLMGRLY